jgi:ABC-type transport system involved in multi-copper enzyme maturation permease subunit
VSRVLAIALTTLREALRNKLLYTILIFACVLILSSWAIGQLSLHEELRVARDLGLAGISLFGVLLSIVGGVNLVYQEIEKKTVYALLAKPIRRFEFVLGKYAGLSLTLLVQMGLMALVLCLAIGVQGSSPDEALARALVLLYVEVLVVTAVALLFSTFSTPLLSGLYTAGIAACGRSTPELRALVETRLKESPALARALTGATSILPDLHLFFVSGTVENGHPVTVHGDYVGWSYVASATSYGLLYAACVLLLAVVIFSRRDFV